MNRSLKLSMLLALALGSTQAMALELGQIQVKSALGQPLLAEIPITPDSPAELRNFTARLASPEDFARAGLAGVRPEVPLQFSIADAGARKVIRITSTVAVNDPYLDLLVEVNSAAGRSLREFPILLDPPGTAPMAPVASTPRSSTPQPATSPTPVRPAAPAPAPAATPARRAAAGGQYGPVDRGQTLSGIARQVAPAGVDTNQMMLALKQANPDAFYQDNINALKSGAVLRVPTSQEAQALSAAAAITEIRRQNSDWRAGATRSTTTVADAATRADTTGATGGSSADDRLALVPAQEGGKGAGAQGGSGKGNTALRQDLLRSQEALTTLQQQSAELKSRLKDLHDINDKNTRLLALKDNEIAELQQKLAEARKNAGLPAAAASTGTSEMTSAPAAASTTPAPAAAGSLAAAGAASVPAAGTTAAPAMASPITKQATTPASKPAPAAAKPAAPVAAEQPWYMQPWVWGAAGGAVLLLILLALLGRRRKPARSSAASTTGASSLADRFGALPATPDVGADPDQDELLDQLAEHPDDIGLHLELVSLYYARRDVDHFEAAAEAMHAHIVDPQQDEWQDVVAMGEDLSPGHPLFAAAAAPERDAFDAAPDEDLHGDDALHPFDLDNYAAHADEPTVTPADATPKRPPVSEYHFDFDLTPNRQASSEVSDDADAEQEPAVAESDDDRTLLRSPDATPAPAEEPAHSSWDFDTSPAETAGTELDADQFSDDPIDTKLDLARAYMDMGDADGARAMLEEVLNEGSRPQKDAAQQLLDSLA